VTAGREVPDQPRRAADELNTSEITAYARAEGITPPTDAPAWDLLPRYEPDGSDGPLMWVLVTPLTADPGKGRQR
jgi:hypothetical protein